MAGNISSRRLSPGRGTAIIAAMSLLAVSGCHESHLFAVSGQVVDRSGQPQAGIHVELKTKSATLDTTTDHGGYFLLQSRFSAPEYDVGRTTATLRVIIDEDHEYQLDVTPSKEPPRGADDKVRILVVL
jgi:hypothetical protein